MFHSEITVFISAIHLLKKDRFCFEVATGGILIDMKPLHELNGVATSYDKQGRSIGYPTANIAAPADAPEGVFIGTVTLRDKQHEAMIFIGRPVTMDKYVKRAEAHILDFPDEDLYGEELQLVMLQRIRSNQKFTSVDELINMIKQDEIITRSYFFERQKASK